MKFFIGTILLSMLFVGCLTSGNIKPLDNRLIGWWLEGSVEDQNDTVFKEYKCFGTDSILHTVFITYYGSSVPLDNRIIWDRQKWTANNDILALSERESSTFYFKDELPINWVDSMVFSGGDDETYHLKYWVSKDGSSVDFSHLIGEQNLVRETPIKSIESICEKATLGGESRFGGEV